MRKAFAIAFIALSLLIGSSRVTTAQQVTSLAQVITGEGTVELDNGDQLRINAVAVFLRANGEAQIWLMTCKNNFYAGGRWLESSVSHAINLEITDDTEDGGATGSATVVLKRGCAPIAGLTMTMSRKDGTSLAADFMTVTNSICSNL